jgi:hypothetical protein
MTNKEFQAILALYPDDMPIKLLPNNTLPQLSFDNKSVSAIIDFTEENIMHTTDQAYVDSAADPETWDTEDGKIVYAGNPFLLINPIIT